MTHMTPKSQKDSKTKSKTHTQDSIPSFIRKTYDILEERKFPDVIDWNPEGTALVIKKPSDFCQKVLPAYFKHNNLTSFVRQLNMYNFHKRRTQNIDHVYYHELFQKGKKHLLKEIKRKNHEHTAEKVQKITEVMEPCQTGKDFSSLVYENQLLKRLYNDAMNKITMLEGQVKELSGQNQSLWSQLCQQSDNETIFKPSFARFDSKTELTLDQLPMTFGEVVIPPLKIAAEKQAAHHFVKLAPSTVGNVNCFLNFTNADETGESTEVSHNSPSLQPSLESDKCFDMPDATPLYNDGNNQVMQLPQITLTPQVSMFQGFKGNELIISKQEMSLGQIFDNWGNEQNMEMFSFTDQRLEKPVQDVTQPTSVLGKRPFEASEDQSFQVPEPLMKRNELSIYNKKAMISIGADDKDLMAPAFRRDSSVNIGYDSNIDLMDFNQPFLEWAKAS